MQLNQISVVAAEMLSIYIYIPTLDYRDNMQLNQISSRESYYPAAKLSPCDSHERFRFV